MFKRKVFIMNSKKYFFLLVGLMALANAGYGLEGGEDGTGRQCGRVSPVLGAGAGVVNAGAGGPGDGVVDKKIQDRRDRIAALRLFRWLGYATSRRADELIQNAKRFAAREPEVAARMAVEAAARREVAAKAAAEAAAREPEVVERMAAEAARLRREDAGRRMGVVVRRQ